MCDALDAFFHLIVALHSLHAAGINYSFSWWMQSNSFPCETWMQMETHRTGYAHAVLYNWHQKCIYIYDSARRKKSCMHAYIAEKRNLGKKERRCVLMLEGSRQKENILCLCTYALWWGPLVRIAYGSWFRAAFAQCQNIYSLMFSNN